jgi:transcriptional antiterminator RfaH
MTASQSRWYVARTQPNAETKAVAHLGRQGFITYLPRYLKRRRHARRIEIVQAPLFPRYLFVQIDTAVQRWRSIYSTFGVSQLVGHSDTPTPVSSHVVATLKSREDATGNIHLYTKPMFCIGDKIQVLDGVFADCLGLYEGMKDSDRVAILLDMLGRKVRVIVDVESVTAA